MIFLEKQKQADEIRIGLVGAEMCIRDRTNGVSNLGAWQSTDSAGRPVKGVERAKRAF